MIWSWQENLKVCNLNNPKFWVQFDGSCLRPDQLNFAPIKIINLYIIYKIKSWQYYVDTGFTYRNSLFGAVKLTKNVDPDKYSYSGYSISFDVPGTFSFSNGGTDKNIIIFGADMSSSRYYDNKKNFFYSW